MSRAVKGAAIGSPEPSADAQKVAVTPRSPARANASTSGAGVPAASGYAKERGIRHQRLHQHTLCAGMCRERLDDELPDQPLLEERQERAHDPRAPAAQHRRVPRLDLRVLRRLVCRLLRGVGGAGRHERFERCEERREVALVEEPGRARLTGRGRAQLRVEQHARLRLIGRPVQHPQEPIDDVHRQRLAEALAQHVVGDRCRIRRHHHVRTDRVDPAASDVMTPRVPPGSAGTSGRVVAMAQQVVEILGGQPAVLDLAAIAMNRSVCENR